MAKKITISMADLDGGWLDKDRKAKHEAMVERVRKQNRELRLRAIRKARAMQAKGRAKPHTMRDWLSRLPNDLFKLGDGKPPFTIKPPKSNAH